MIQIKYVGEDPTKLMQKLSDVAIPHIYEDGIIKVKVWAGVDRDDLINRLFGLIPDLRFGE